VTGAPIYLVSACTSGEEFVAAFRRYSDKNGLFVPIREPLPVGRRSRFAVTLKDGGVMIEGEAEIVSSARTASVLHGRVGMTLRFLEPDDASKTMLRDLEKARLAMRPAPPSVSPRPAEIPAEPRPVLPPVQGRIDAVNALAECVVIGDPDAAAVPPAPPAPAALPPKAGPRFVAPTVPTVPAPPGAPGAPAVPAAPAAISLGAVALPPPPAPPPAIAQADERESSKPPSIVPRATPQPEPPHNGLPPRTDPAPAALSISGFSRTMIAVAPLLEPGPTSDTFVAVTPPEPPAAPPAAAPPAAAPPAATSPAATSPAAVLPAAAPPNIAPPPAPAPVPPRRAVEMAAIPRPITNPEPAESPRRETVSDTMTAVPMPGATTPSAPTEIGAVPVEPLPPINSVVSAVLHDDPSARTQVHAGVPPRDPPAAAPHDASAAPIDRPAGRPPARAEVSTQRGPAVDRAQAKPTTPAPTTQPSSPEVPELKRKPAPEPVLEIDDTAPADPEAAPSRGGATHIGMPPIPRSAAPVSPLPAGPRPAPPIVAPERPTILDVEIAEPTDLSLGPPEPPAPVVEPPSQDAVVLTLPEAPARTPRKTVIGVVIAPSGQSVLPANAPSATGDAAGDASLQEADEVTGTARIVIGEHALEVTAPTAPPPLPATADEATPDAAWTMPPAGATPPSAPDNAPAAPAASDTPAATLPSGDWTIALDPQAPDGWSEPFEMISPDHLTEDPPSGPAPATVGPPPARDAVPKRPTPRPDVLPSVEPKVQIDPTLIEPLQPVGSDPPLRPMPPDAPLGSMPLENPFRRAPSSSVDMPSYGSPPGAISPAPPLVPMMPSPPQPSPFVIRRGPTAAHTGEAPAYPMDPSYQMVPVPGLAAPEPFTAADSGLGDPRYASETALPARAGRRRAIIVIVSALVAVVIGIVLLLVFGGKHDAGTAPGTAVDKAGAPPVEPKQTSPTTSSPGPTKAGSQATTDTPPIPDPDRGANGPASGPDPATAAPKSPTAAAAPSPGAADAAGSNAGADAARPDGDTCFADVSSVPAGAEIVIDQTNVIGTTPQKVTLPCGNPVELTIRKGRLVPAVHTVTPTAEGAKLRVALAKPTFQVKVSSTPAGATVTMNGKSLGVTPTMIRIPAFEASALTITKDGYATETETVTPKSNGVAVHSTLKKADRKKPR
jgi:PEGA domain-containing protein